MIGVSTLLIYQHHVIDLYSAAISSRDFVSRRSRKRLPPRRRRPLQPFDSPCPPPSFTKAPPRFWRSWSKSSLATVCAGSDANLDTRQRIYFANHTSHLDALVLWAALRPEVRSLTRPVAARDYWTADPVRRHLATCVFPRGAHRASTRFRARAQSHRAVAGRARRRPLLADDFPRRHARPRAGPGAFQGRSVPSRQTPAGHRTRAGAHRQHESHPTQGRVAARAAARRPELRRTVARPAWRERRPTSWPARERRSTASANLEPMPAFPNLQAHAAGGRRTRKRSGSWPACSAFLGVASVVGAVLGRRTAGAGESTRATIANLNARLRAWWVIVTVCALALLLGRIGATVLFGLASFWALREFITLTPTQPGDHRALFWVFFVITPLQYFLVVDPVVRNVHHPDPGLRFSFHSRCGWRFAANTSTSWNAPPARNGD